LDCEVEWGAGCWFLSKDCFVKAEIRISFIDAAVHEHLLLDFPWNMLPKLLNEPDFFGQHFLELGDFFDTFSVLTENQVEYGENEFAVEFGEFRVRAGRI
jgi:hypothetical protein